MPDRIQLKRKRGWRLPEGAVSVGRPTKWGNPFTAAGAIETGFARTREQGREVAVEFYRRWILFEDAADSDIYTTATRTGEYDRRWVRDHLAGLRGRTLACWCPLPADGEPDICHARVLLDLANGSDRA